MPEPATILIASDFVLDPALDAAADILSARGHRVIRGPAAVPGRKTVFEPRDMHRYFADTDVIVASSRVAVDQHVLDAAPRLRGIVYASIGLDSLDLPAATRRGILVANGATPENFQSMAEATVMLMLNLAYDLRGTEELLRTCAPRPPVLRARMLKGKTIGLIGLGRIARGVIQRLQGWSVDIVACSPGTQASRIPGGVRLVDLDELLAISDIVSVHATLTDQSRNLIGPAELRKMKRNAYLINTARGGCVDEQAVYEALRSRIIAGAALDTFAVEPLPVDSPLRELDNAILTPHMVGHTQELFASFAPACVENVEGILDGVVPAFVCNPSVEPAWRGRLRELDALA